MSGEKKKTLSLLANCEDDVLQDKLKKVCINCPNPPEHACSRGDLLKKRLTQEKLQALCIVIETSGMDTV